MKDSNDDTLYVADPTDRLNNLAYNFQNSKKARDLKWFGGPNGTD